MFLTLASIVVFITFWFIASPKHIPCDHNLTFEYVIKEESCTEKGKYADICCWCGDTILEKTVELAEHDFGEFIEIVGPSINKNGLESRYCRNCNLKEDREIICEHKKTIKVETQKVSCKQEGINTYVCDRCGTVISEEYIEKKDCKYGDWKYTRYATPVKEGSRYKKCRVCGNVVTESYTMSMPGKNSIYISGTNIKAKMTITSMTQSSIDNNDIVYTEDKGKNNPFILGHDYGSLGALHKTKVGEHIYLSINGKIQAYKVVLSESATQTSDKKDIISKSGTSIFYNYGCKTLHIYTCYGTSKNGRWMVLAVPE